MWYWEILKWLAIATIMPVFSFISAYFMSKLYDFLDDKMEARKARKYDKLEKIKKKTN